MKMKKFLFSGLLLMFLNLNIAQAEIIEQTVEATGEYRLGDNDTRAQAKDAALSDAKRVAAEKVMVYVKSNSQIENYEVIKDKIETYTQAKMQILDQKYSFVGEEGTICQANILANVKIDIDEIERQRQEEERRQRQEEENRQRQEEEQRRHQEKNQSDDKDILKAIITAVIDKMMSKI